jgi:PAS domain S-box-containing protein
VFDASQRSVAKKKLQEMSVAVLPKLAETLGIRLLRDEPFLDPMANITGVGTQGEQAETRVDQANTRTKQAEARTAQANTRADQANLRTDEANTRTDEANTRRDHAEARSVQAILDSGISYRRLFETAQDGILILDAGTGQVVDANPFMKALLGYSQEEFLGRKLWDIGPFKGEAASKVAFAELRIKDRLRYEGLPLETKDGRRVEVEFISSAYLEGTKRLIQCNIRDTTERRQAEKTALRLAAIVESSEDAIIGKDLEGIIQSWNGGAEKIFGYSAGEMIGKPITPLLPVGRLDEEQQILEKINRGESIRPFDTVRLAKGGQQIDVSVTVSPIKDSTGTLVGSSKVLRDITESKRGEKRINELNAELEAFSYSVSHDLRAPLRHVMGFVELLQRHAGPSLSEKSVGYLATISRSAKRMGSLIDDLLSFSKIGRSGMKKGEVNLDELVQDALGDFEADLKGRNVVWDIHPLPVIHCDRALLRMVLVNLIANAIKFTARCPQTKIEIGTFPQGDTETVIFIRDNGVGFDPRYVHKLFGVFQRLHSVGEFEGTGIGLANVQRIIHRHGGRVWAEGAVNGGATFYLSLPIQIPILK